MFRNAAIIARRILAAHGGDFGLARQAACRTASRSSVDSVREMFADAAYEIQLLGEGCPS